MNENSQKETVKIVLTEDDPNRFPTLPDYVTKIYTAETPKKYREFNKTVLTNTVKNNRETWRLQSIEFGIDTGVPTTRKIYDNKEAIVEKANKIARRKGKNVRFEVK